MKNYKRALRRHHRQRLQNNRRNYWLVKNGSEPDFKPSKKMLNRVISTPKSCSCFMCGNPRKYFKLKTVQERRYLSSELKKT